jgi:hypothetical protein
MNFEKMVLKSDENDENDENEKIMRISDSIVSQKRKVKIPTKSKY